MFREYKGSESCVGRCGGRSYNSRFIRDKTMADKLMYFPNGDTQNYPFCKISGGNVWKLNSWIIEIKSPHSCWANNYENIITTLCNKQLSVPSLPEYQSIGIPIFILIYVIIFKFLGQRYQIKFKKYMLWYYAFVYMLAEIWVFSLTMWTFCLKQIIL